MNSEIHRLNAGSYWGHWVSFKLNKQAQTFKGKRAKEACFLLSMYSLKLCFSPALAQGFLLLSLLTGSNSLCTRKGFLPTQGYHKRRGGNAWQD